MNNNLNVIDISKLDDNIVGMGIMIFLLFIVMIVIWYVTVQINKQDKNCSYMEDSYTNNVSVTNIDFSNDDYSHNLNEYYILGASNCCASGENKNDYVDICALNTCIKNGARF